MDWLPQQLLTTLQAMALFLFFVNSMLFCKRYVLVNVCQTFVFFTYLGNYQIDAERNPVPKNGRFLS